MPLIKKHIQPPLPPPGESVGILRQMSCIWVTPKPGSKIREPYQAFKGTLQLHTGEKVPVSVPLLEQTAFIIRNLCRSAELLIPEDGSEFILTGDDLEGCRVFVGIKHEDYNGRTVARIAFHTESYATQVDPSLRSVTFPREAPRGTRLKTVAPSSEEPPKGPPADPFGAPAIPKLPVESTGGSTSLSDLGGISDAEFEEAIRNAREQRAKKDGRTE